MENNFDEIRCFNNQEIPEILAKLTNEKQFVKILSTIFPLMPKDQLRKTIQSFSTAKELQHKMIFPYLKSLESNQTKGIDLFGIETLKSREKNLFISNHRDIVLDSAFLCAKLIENKRDTVQIAIGDNLFAYPWIKDLVRVNKSFIVKRGLEPRQLLASSQQLSAYIHHIISTKKDSIWIAQREGRAKDANDTTQESLLKMLSMSGEGKNAENLIDLNIRPLTISYEYDPCDFLKAAEFQLKRDNSTYKKTKEDDVISMTTGILGYKGKIDYHIADSINDELTSLIANEKNKNKQYAQVAQLIDKHIHANYTIFNVNKIALDLINDTAIYASEYSQNEKKAFEEYVEKQIAKIQIPNKDTKFLRTKIWEMYANPFKNFKIATD